MRVIFDARVAGTGKHGIARVAEQLCHALPAHLPTGWELQILRLSSTARGAQGSSCPQSDSDAIDNIACRSRPYSLGEQFEIPRLIREQAPGLYHLPTFWGSFRPKNVVRIHTIYDLIHPLFYRQKLLYRIAYRRGVARQVRDARVVVTCSESSARTICEFFALPRERVRVIPIGVDHLPKTVPAAEGLPVQSGEFIYSLINPRPHKNLAALLAAYLVYRERLAQPLPLLIIGADEKLSAPKANIHVRSFLDDAQLHWVRENASFGVFPSLMEGFNLPLLEALRSGGPVVASDIPPHREIVGPDYPLFLPTAERLAAAMVRFHEEEGLLKELAREGLEIAAPYTWERSAKALIDLWGEVAE